MNQRQSIEPVRYSVSLVTQGKHRFYTLTMPSETLAKTCYVSTRYDDPLEGFQRLLDKDRAKQIADYIDNGLGTIPNSIVLSAQQDSEFRVIGKGKTIQFLPIPKAFLIIDGQHRVYGFTMARTSLRVPVVIYHKLTRKDESRLFIDINTKQRPVPNELLLDIKKLAEYETDMEKQLGEIFDMFNDSSDSPLLGKMSASQKAANKLSRVTFYAALKPLVGIFEESDTEGIYNALKSYIIAFDWGCKKLQLPDILVNPTVFRASMLLFKEAALRVQDRYGKNYSVSNFSNVLDPMFNKLKRMQLKSPGRSHKELYGILSDNFKQQFTL